MSPTFFSIIIPTYNRAGLIGLTLQKALAQSYPNFEVIVVDDGSKDHTEEIVLGLNSPKISYFKKNNAERAAARNYGVARAKGHYVTFLDSDDWIYENHLEEANRMIEQHQSPAWFHLGYEMRTPEGNLISQYNQRVGNLGNLMIEGNQLSCIGVFIRKEIMEANLFNETRALSGSEDWEVWTRMASRYSLYYSNTVTSCIVNHEDRSVLNIKEQPLLERIMLAGNLLMQDKPFMEHFGKRVPQMWAHLYFYMALHLVMSKQLGRGWHYVWKAIHSYPPILFTKKFLGILRQSTRV